MNMRKTVAILLALIMTCTALPLSVFAVPDQVWDGTVAESYAGGTGTQADPYLISNGAQLAYLAQMVNTGESYSDTYFKMTNDIVLNDTANLENWSSEAPANVWPIIGVDEKLSNGDWPAFEGHFDGGFHEVRGMYINGGPTGNYVGLFGYVTDGSIRNLGVSDSYVRGSECVGSIAGYTCGLVENCYNAGTVTAISADAAGCIGGVVGCLYDTPLRNCWNTGNVEVSVTTEAYYIGGVVGENMYSPVENCYNAGTVTVVSNANVYGIGGVAGEVDSGSAANCYNAGPVTVTSTATDSDYIYCFGSVAGDLYESTASGLYYLEGTLTHPLSEDSEDASINVGATALTAEAARLQASYEGFDFENVWTMGTGDYPYPMFHWHTWSNGTCTECGATCSHQSWSGGSCAVCGTACNHSYVGGACSVCGSPCNHRFLDGICRDCSYACSHQWTDGRCPICDLICANHIWNSSRGTCGNCGIRCRHENLNGNFCTTCGYDITSTPIWDGSVSAAIPGSGTREDPYCITSGSDLAWLAHQVNTGDSFCTYPDNGDPIPKYVVLTTDIDLNGIPFPSIGDPADYNSSWFAGCFDGRNHTISGLNNEGCGLFGTTGGSSDDPTSDWGRISNLHVEGTVRCTEACADVGGIVGRAQGGTLENLSFTGSIIVDSMGYYFYGGIVGEMERGFVFDCVSNAGITVTGSAMPRGVGGIVGGAEYNPPLVDGCANHGAITTTPAGQGVGGIAGKGDTVLNSCNTGAILVQMGSFDSWELKLGGIAGWASAIVNCYNLGSLTADEALTDAFVGGINGDGAEVFNCYNAGAVTAGTGCIASIGGIPTHSFALESNLPPYCQWDSGQGVYVGVYDNSMVKTEAELKAEGFCAELNSYLVSNPSYSFVDYDGNTFTRVCGTWYQTNGYPALEAVSLEVFSQTVSGEPVGQVHMNGTVNQFTVGEKITLSVRYDRESYRFIGWYAGKDFTNVLSASENYTITVTRALVEQGTLTVTALFEKIDTNSITVNGGGAIFTVNSEEYSSTVTKKFRPCQVVTVTANGEDFAYWSINVGNGTRIVSYEFRYTFIVGGDLVLNAVYNSKLAGKYTVIYVSDYGQVLHREQLTPEGIRALTPPEVPLKTGCTGGSWSMTPEQIAAAAESGQDVITVTPVYEQIQATATVTVVGGTIRGESGNTFLLNTKLVLDATVPEGKTFAYWQDGDGNILSYNATYALYVSRELVLTAVFTNDAVEQVGTAQITDIVKAESVNGISFTATFSVPKGSTIVFAGVVATKDPEKALVLTAANADYVRGNAQDHLSGRFTWTKSRVGAEEWWYVRAYLVYKDANGVTHTVYSSLVKARYCDFE